MAERFRKTRVAVAAAMRSPRTPRGQATYRSLLALVSSPSVCRSARASNSTTLGWILSWECRLRKGYWPVSVDSATTSGRVVAARPSEGEGELLERRRGAAVGPQPRRRVRQALEIAVQEI